MPSIVWRQRLLLWCLHNIPSTIRNPTRVYLPTHTLAERSSRMEESAPTRGGLGNDERETFAKVILRWSGEHGCLSNESLNIIRSARSYPLQNVLWQETWSIPRQDIQFIAYIHIPNEKQQKLDPKSDKCILVVYSLEKKGYKCFNSSTKMVHVSRDVVFDESASWYTINSTPSNPVKTEFDTDAEEDDRSELTLEVSPISTGLSGPKQPPSKQSTSRPSPK